MVLSQLRRFRNFMLAVIVVGSVGVRPVMAAPVLFTDEAAFNAAVAGAGIAIRQDGFEGLAAGYRGPLDREGFTVREGPFPTRRCRCSWMRNGRLRGPTRYSRRTRCR